MAKPDNRRDNAVHLKKAIVNTQENWRETTDALKAHGAEMSEADRASLSAKNNRRAQAIDGFRDELKEEAHHQDTER